MGRQKLGQGKDIEGVAEVMAFCAHVGSRSKFLADLSIAFLDVSLSNTDPKLLRRELQRVYVDVLEDNDKLYHFDDDPSDIEKIGSGEKTFSEEEVLVVRHITGVLYGEQLFKFALGKV